MQKFITSLFLMTSYLPWLDAKVQEQATLEQIKQNIQLVDFFNQSQKQTSGNIITVGGDPNGCQFNNIQDAINSIALSGNDKIHIATNKTYNENLIIDDISVSLIGGYQDCTAAGSPFIQPSETQVLVNAGNNASALKITSNSQRRTVLLRNLRFIEGSGATPNADSAGGGILVYEADVAVSLRNVDVTSNDAEYGGGIAIIDGDTDMHLQNSRVFNNLAGYGAGIYCAGGASSIVMTENSGLVANVANGDNGGLIVDKQGRGGGAFIDGCYFGMHSGSANGGLVGIASNIAFDDGGGIHAENGATVLLNGHQVCNAGNCIGDNNNPVNVSGNTAGFNQGTVGDGGGISAMGNSTLVTIYAGLVNGNSSGFGGGGIAMYQAKLIIRRLYRSCWDQDHCNYIADNVVNNTGESTSGGGAIRNYRGQIDISGSVFENNFAVRGAAIYSRSLLNDDATTRVESSMLYKNGDDTSQSIIYSLGEIPVDFIHTTIADNSMSSNALDVAVFRSEISAGGPDLSLHSSIVENADFAVLSHNMLNYAVDISCIIANETESMSASNNLINFSEGTAGGAFISQDNPIFLDPQNSNYYLAGNSPAIDYCHTPTHTTVLYKDIEFENRGYDDPNVDDLSLFTLYDLGADESYINDRIFKDGFE